MRVVPLSELKTKWSIWVAALWGSVGGLILVGSAYLYTNWDWRIGALIVAMSSSFAVARWLKQPGTEQ
jgi:hypothetical protein